MLVRRAQAAGLGGEALHRYRARLAQLTPEQLSALDPASLVSADPGRQGAATQPHGTTCGSASLVMSRMLNNPAYAMYVMTGYDPATGRTDTRSAQARFHEESLTMHERTNRWRDRDGNLQVRWPLGLGTSPWAVANEMSSRGGSGVPGTAYEVDWTWNDSRGASWDKMATASRAGHTVPVYVGGTVRDGGVPRHVVLVTGHGDGTLTFYEPGESRSVTVSRQEWLDGTFSLGGWSRPKAIIVPAD